jgi:hypothetical protein
MHKLFSTRVLVRRAFSCEKSSSGPGPSSLSSLIYYKPSAAPLCCSFSSTKSTNNNGAEIKTSDDDNSQQQQQQQQQPDFVIPTTTQKNKKQQLFKHIPAPSWSMADLELDAQHPPVPQEELDRLSRLALIDIHVNNTKSSETSAPENKESSLNQDLANMLHMIQQVKDYSGDATATATDDSSSSYIYDTVRGVSVAPLRKAAADDPLQAEDEIQAKDVWESLLQPKTIRIGGGRHYFSIVTAEEEGIVKKE